MDKKDITEIKKLFVPDKCSIEKIRTCFVTHDADGACKKFSNSTSFLTMPEEEVHKYLAFFKKALSGTVGKTLKRLPFSTKEETEGTCHPFLMDIIQSQFDNEELIDQLYDKIIEGYSTEAPYCIIFANMAYDVPSKATDGTTLEDSSDEVYNFMFCIICPVHLRDGELGILPDSDKIEELTRDMVVQAPDKAFLFPAFTERATDIHEALYYSKKSKDLQPSLIDILFGCPAPYSDEEQQYIFNDLAACAFGDDISFETLQTVQGKINSFIDEAEEDNPVLDRQSIERIFRECGADDDGIRSVAECYENIGEKTTIETNNIVIKDQMKIKSPDISITIKKEASERVEYKVIDGHKCLVIQMDNGLNVDELDVMK